ncbi:MAG: purine-nucleoside phosphorylase, partial [Muribaculaceae bacterium]
MLNRINETADYIRNRAGGEMPKTAIILGTGLGSLVDYIEDKLEIPYQEIPNMPVSTVEGHSGKLIFGSLGGKRIIAMQGRFHYYEGFTMKEVAYPVYVMKLMGIENMIVTNACGGINPTFKPGDLMIIDDFINSVGTNP